MKWTTYVQFWTLIATHSRNDIRERLKLVIPDTAIYLNGKLWIWLFTAKTGEVLRHVLRKAGERVPRTKVNSLRSHFIQRSLSNPNNVSRTISVSHGSEGFTVCNPHLLQLDEFHSLTERLRSVESGGECSRDAGLSVTVQPFVQPVNDIRYSVSYSRPAFKSSGLPSISCECHQFGGRYSGTDSPHFAESDFFASPDPDADYIPDPLLSRLRSQVLRIVMYLENAHHLLVNSLSCDIIRTHQDQLVIIDVLFFDVSYLPNFQHPMSNVEGCFSFSSAPPSARQSIVVKPVRKGEITLITPREGASLNLPSANRDQPSPATTFNQSSPSESAPASNIGVDTPTPMPDIMDEPSRYDDNGDIYFMDPPSHPSAGRRPQSATPASSSSPHHDVAAFLPLRSRTVIGLQRPGTCSPTPTPPNVPGPPKNPAGDVAPASHLRRPHSDVRSDPTVSPASPPSAEFPTQADHDGPPGHDDTNVLSDPDQGHVPVSRPPHQRPFVPPLRLRPSSSASGQQPRRPAPGPAPQPHQRLVGTTSTATDISHHLHRPRVPQPLLQSRSFTALFNPHPSLPLKPTPSLHLLPHSKSSSQPVPGSFAGGFKGSFTGTGTSAAQSHSPTPRRSTGIATHSWTNGGAVQLQSRQKDVGRRSMSTSAIRPPSTTFEAKVFASAVALEKHKAEMVKARETTDRALQNHEEAVEQLERLRSEGERRSAARAVELESIGATRDTLHSVLQVEARDLLHENQRLSECLDEALDKLDGRPGGAQFARRTWENGLATVRERAAQVRQEMDSCNADIKNYLQQLENERSATASLYPRLQSMTDKCESFDQEVKGLIGALARVEQDTHTVTAELTTKTAGRKRQEEESILKEVKPALQAELQLLEGIWDRHLGLRASQAQTRPKTGPSLPLGRRSPTSSLLDVQSGMESSPPLDTMLTPEAPSTPARRANLAVLQSVLNSEQYQNFRTNAKALLHKRTRGLSAGASRSASISPRDQKPVANVTHHMPHQVHRSKGGSMLMEPFNLNLQMQRLLKSRDGVR